MSLTAIVTPTDIPGLVDVAVSDGRELRDLTMGQLKGLALRERWDVEVPGGRSVDVGREGGE